jgi:CRP-like cAMP-binding protein
MTPDQMQNRLLAALPQSEFEQLAPALEPVSLDLGVILYEPPDVIQHVYFPTTCIVSFIAELPDGSGAEVGLVGNEAMAGVEVILGVERAAKVATVQGAGHALRLKPHKLREVFAQGGPLQQHLLRYTHVFISQISASVLCNVRHNIAQRLARWLLMYHDRAGTDDFYLTQEFMANMLGIRRAGVSEVAKQLQDAGLVAYDRGKFRMLNRHGLERLTCECYPVVRAEFDKLYT